KKAGSTIWCVVVLLVFTMLVTGTRTEPEVMREETTIDEAGATYAAKGTMMTARPLGSVVGDSMSDQLVVGPAIESKVVIVEPQRTIGGICLQHLGSYSVKIPQK